jgi:hypothetical protein
MGDEPKAHHLACDQNEVRAEEVARRGESVGEGNAAAFDGLEKSFRGGGGPAAEAQDTEEVPEDETVLDEEVGALESAFRDLTVDTKSILGEGSFAKVMVASRPGGERAWRPHYCPQST